MARFRWRFRFSCPSLSPLLFLTAFLLIPATVCRSEDGSIAGTKWADLDGDGTRDAGDYGVEGWTIYLVVDEQRQEPGQSTGPDGCTTWSELAPAHGYGVEEAVESGWEALTPTEYDFGLALPGESYEAEFVNTETDVLIFLPLILR